MDITLAGQLLYGPRWQFPLSRLVGVSASTIINWTKGRFPVPKPARDKIIEALAERELAIQAFMREAG